MRSFVLFAAACVAAQGVARADTLAGVEVTYQQGGCDLPAGTYSLQLDVNNRVFLKQQIKLAGVGASGVRHFSFPVKIAGVPMEGKHTFRLSSTATARGYWSIALVGHKGAEAAPFSRVFFAGAPAARAFHSSVKKQALAEEPWRDFLSRAVFHGLKQDGVPPELVERLVKGKNFVGKCQICESTKRGMQRYLALKEAPKGKGLGEEVMRQLKDDKAAVRLEALRRLVAGYVERRFKALEVPEAHRAKLKTEIEAERKKAMPRAKGELGVDFCPSCDGACLIEKAGRPG